MLVIGKLKLQGVDYIFSRIETDTKIGWYIFNKTITTVEGNTYRLDFDDLLAFKAKNIKPFIASAYEATFDKTKYAGNPYIVNMLMSEYSKQSGRVFPKVSREYTNIDSGTLLETISEDDKDHSYFNKIEYIKDLKVSEEDGELISADKTKLFMKELGLENLVKNNKVNKSYIYSINFGTKNIVVETVTQRIKNPKNSTLDLKWEDLDDPNISNKKVKEATLADKQKSLSQLRLLKDLSHFFDKRGKLKKNYVIVDTYDKLKELAHDVFPKIKFWMVDVESTGLNEYKGDNPEDFDHIVSIMMSWEKDQAIFIPIDMEYMPNISGGDWLSILKYWLEKIPSGGHNIGFDARALLVDFNIKLNFIHDTMQLNFNINTHRAKFNNGLKYLEEKILGVSPLELKDIFGTAKLAGLFRWIKDPVLALLYACADVDLCLQVFEYLWEELPVSGRTAYKLDMDTLKHVVTMDMWGNRINVDLAKKLREANNADKDLLEEMIYSLVGQTLVFKEKYNSLLERLKEGKIDENGIIKELTEFQNSSDYLDARYKFDINSGKQLGEVMFNFLDYPEQGKSDKTGLPSVDAKALGKLLRIKTNKTTRLKKNIRSHESDVFGKNIDLIKAKEYNELTYPLALLVTEYRLRNKRNTTFFKQLLDTSIEGRYYSQSKMASAETFRIINVIQTLQGFMKQMIIPYDDDHYMIVFDFSQIEYRFMAGLGKQEDLISRLNSFRADFHKECCALLHKIKAYMVTHKMRKNGKSLNFAIPYGMGDYSIAESLYKVVNKKTLIDARLQLARWKEIFEKIWNFLEKQRDFAIANGYVENPLHRRRYFYNGTNYGEYKTEEEAFNAWDNKLTRTQIKAIRRMSGNFPIQSGAADLFKIALRDFRKRLEKEGLADLVKTTAVIHDEMVNSVHKSVNPYYLYRIIWEEVMKNVKGHPRYYAGISVCDNWYEGKDDLYEAPIEFVNYIINSPKSKEKFVYQENAKITVMNDIIEYMTEVFKKEFAEVGCDLANDTLDLKYIIDNMEDYFIRDRISVYYGLPKHKGKVDKNYENDEFIRSFEEFVLKNKQRDSYTIVYPDDYPLGKRAIITDNSRTFLDENGNILKQEIYLENTEDLAKENQVKEAQDKEDLVIEKLDLFSGFEATEDVTEDLGLFEEDSYEDEKEELSLDLAHDTETSDIRINQLRLFELEEEGEEGSIFSNDLYFNIPDTSTIEDEQAEIDANPEKFNRNYSELTSKVKCTPNSIIVDVNNMDEETYDKLYEYLNEHSTTKDDLAAVEFIRKIGIQYDDTGIYIKDFSIEEIREIVDSETVKA